MVAYTWEKAKSVDLTLVPPTDQTGSTFKTTWCVIGTDSESAAASAVAANSGLTYVAPTGELLLRSKFNPKNTGPDSWEVDVEYTAENDPANQEPPEGGDPGTWHFSFSSKGGKQKIYQAISTRCSGERSATNSAPDLFGAIGWDGKRVNGVEVPVGQLEFQITAYYSPQYITIERMGDWAEAVGKMNSDTFLGRPAGEILYLGADGSGDIPTQNGQRVKPIKINHSYLFSKNIPTPTVGDITLSCTKLGHDYLDVKYEKIEDLGFVYAIPVHAYVQVVAEELAMATFFGFGGSGGSGSG